MRMEASDFLIIGSGHSESINQFNNNGMLQTPGGNLLIDCGYTIKPALASHSLSIDDIDAIFITHIHGDHVFGLERVAFETRFNRAVKPQLFLQPDLVNDLWEHTLKGSLGYINGVPQSLDDYFDVHIIKNNRFTYNGHCIRVIKVDHAPGRPAYGILIDQFLFYSGDTKAIRVILEGLDFEVGFHDCSLFSSSPVHANLEDLISEYPQAIKSKLYLMSYEDNWQSREAEVNTHFKGLAKSGLRLPIPCTTKV